jgi:hypothetical protein
MTTKHTYNWTVGITCKVHVRADAAMERGQLYDFEDELQDEVENLMDDCPVEDVVVDWDKVEPGGIEEDDPDGL